MIHVRLSRSLNFQFGAFTVLVLLALIHSCRGHVIGQTIMATVGEDVVLPSLLDPVMDAFGMTVEWTRPDLYPRFVYVWRDGMELENKKNRLYKGRTSVFSDELKLGNISLKLSRVRISDQGQYRCFIPDLDKDHVVQLVVGAASSPVVQKTKNSSGLVLQCNSTGWYPEPEVLWLDGEGNLLSAGPTETVRGPDDLYTVSSRVTVEKRHSNSFTCRVQQNHTKQTREAFIHVPDDFFADPSGSSSSLPVIIGVILGIVVVLAAAAAVVVWKWRPNKIRNRKQRQDEEGGNSPEQKLLMGGETDGKHPTEETERVNNVDEFRGEPGQTETDEETLQPEANNAQCAESEGTELQLPEEAGGQTTRETETGLDQSQEETETEAVSETDSLHPVSTDLNNKDTKTVTMVEERQKDHKKQTGGKKEEQHGDQPTAGTLISKVHQNKETTVPQTQPDGKRPQPQTNNAVRDLALAEGGAGNGSDKREETMVEERQKDNKQQTEVEENIQPTAVDKGAQCSKEEDKYGDQPMVETGTNVHSNNEATDPQTQTDLNNSQVSENEEKQGGPASAEGGTGNVSDKREEAETEPVNKESDEDAPHPDKTDLNKKGDENKTKSDNTEKPKKGKTEKNQPTEGEKDNEEKEEGGNSPELKLLMGGETDGKQPTEETERVNNVDELRGEPGQTETDEETLQPEANNAQCADSEGTELQFPEEAGGQTTRETETGLDQSQEETETEAVSETDSLHPVSTDLNNKETKTVKMLEERQKDNNQPTADKKGAQCLKEEDKHGEQPKVKTAKTNVHRNNEATGAQNQTDAQTPQIEQNNAKGAVIDRTDSQSTVRDGQRDRPWAEGEIENGLDKSQDETGIKPVKAGDVPDPAENDPNNKEDENKTTSDNTEKPQEGQTENTQQTEEEEKSKCAADETGGQSLIEEDKHGEQQTAERETLRDTEKENLERKLKTKNRELKELERKVTRYEGQMKDKEKQINEVKQQLEEVKRQPEETERKMRSEQREEDYKLLSVLNKKKEELQKQLEKLEKQLEGIKKSVIIARQKKLKATNEKEERKGLEGIKKSENMPRQQRKATDEEEEPMELEMQNNQSDPGDSLTAEPMMVDEQ